MAKPQLDFEIKTTKHIDYSELEKFYTKVYKPKEEYSFVAIEECGNDSSHEFSVTGNIDKYDAKDALAIRAGDSIPTHKNHLLLDVLCADGHLPKGDYVIWVSW